MEYIESPDAYCLGTVAGDGDPRLYDAAVQQPMEDSKVTGRILIGVRHRATADALKMARALARAGLRRSIIYLQCVARRGKLYPMDLNLRPGTMWSLAAVRLIDTAYEELLSVMLGYSDGLRMRWPAPYVGIARVPIPLREGRYRVQMGAGATSLLDEIRYHPGRYYDIGHSWPLFAVRCRRPGEFAARLRAAVATTKLVRLGRAKRHA